MRQALVSSAETGVVAKPLWSGFRRSAQDFADRTALQTPERSLTYAELEDLSLGIAATIQSRLPDSEPALTAVLAYRSATAFAGVLGSLLAGHGYVPLNPHFPRARTQNMLEQSGCRSIVVDAESLGILTEVLEQATGRLLVVAPEVRSLGDFRVRWPGHDFVDALGLESPSAWREAAIGRDAIAYLLFTSGSTGVPKGVMVGHRNVAAFVGYMCERYAITEQDRFSQMFEMTFDLSAFDMFVCWEKGACLCCPSRKTLIQPGKFIREQQLTSWFSVPSTVGFMKQFGALKPGLYPSLRRSLFCGEPLPVSSAAAWQEAAPNSIVENLYGPTELTIACTLYRWNSETSPGESELGIVPIGTPYPGMEVLVVDENLLEVDAGEEGELLMRGPQMSLGYWKNPSKTGSAFIVPPGKSETYYRTGDRVRKPSAGKPLTHLGRVDFQVKILGHRVELGEVEAVVRQVTSLDGVVAVGWPACATGFAAIEAFIEGTLKPGEELSAIQQSVASRLPDYMVPRRFHFMPELPRNANGKFDRKAMMKLLEDGL